MNQQAIDSLLAEIGTVPSLDEMGRIIADLKPATADVARALLAYHRAVVRIQAMYAMLARGGIHLEFPTWLAAQTDPDRLKAMAEYFVQAGMVELSDPLLAGIELG